jgi:hypothetical protein
LENKSRAALPRSAYGGGDIFALFERVDVESKYSRTKSKLLKLLLKFKKIRQRARETAGTQTKRASIKRSFHQPHVLLQNSYWRIQRVTLARRTLAVLQYKCHRRASMVNENNTGAVTLGPSYIVTNSHQFDNYWSFFVASMRHVPIVAVNCQSMHVSNIPGVVHAHDDGDESKVCGTHAQRFLLLSRITRNISTTPT